MILKENCSTIWDKNTGDEKFKILKVLLVKWSDLLFLRNDIKAQLPDPVIEYWILKEAFKVASRIT
jgi:hypothetical protein